MVHNPGPRARVSARCYQRARFQFRVNCIVAQCSEPFSPCSCVHWPFFVWKLECFSRVVVVNTSAWKNKIELAAWVPSQNCEFCVFLFFASSIACTLRGGSNDQCDGNRCCPSVGGSLRRHHQEWSLRLHCTQHAKTHQALTQ